MFIKNKKSSVIYDIIIQLVLLLIFVLISFIVSTKKSVWRDEAFSIITSTQNTAEIIKISSQDFGPPIYYIFLEYWGKIFGSNHISLRSSSLIFAAITIAILCEAVFMFYKEIDGLPADQKKGLALPNKFILYLFLSVNPILMYFSAELRSYAMMAMLILITVISTVKILNHKNLSWAIALCSANLLLLYSHNLSIIWILSLSSTTLIVTSIEKNWPGLKRILANFAVTALLYLPWISVSIKQTARIQDSFWITFNPLQSIKEFDGLFLINEGIRHFPRIEASYILLIKLALAAGMIGWLFSKTATQKYIRFNRKLPQLATLSREFNSLILLSGTALALSLFGFYMFSILATPIMYVRYFSMFSGIVALMLTASLILLYNLFKPLTYGIISTHIVLSALIYTSFMKGNSKVDYERLEIIKTPIYTQEWLDIAVCNYYNKSCYYVGDITITPKYTGSPQLSHLPSIDEWSQIHDEEFYVLRRIENDQDMPARISIPEYTLTTSEKIGENVQIDRYKQLN